MRAAEETMRPKAAATRMGAGEVMEISEVMKPDDVVIDVSLPSNPRLLEFVAQTAADALGLREGDILEALQSREHLGSTGIGGGIVSNGRLLDGAAGNAGHIGHVYVADDTEAWPGHPAGLLETEASGTAIAMRSGRSAAEADATTIDTIGRLVGRGVASVANLLDLQLAVVAGSVALGYGTPFFAAAQDEIDRLCGHLDFSRSTTIRPAGLGDAGPLVGAAAVALRSEGVDIGIA